MAKIAILGGGESGVGAALLAQSKGFEVFLSDSGILKDEYQLTLTNNNIPFESGQHTLSKILDANEIIISPGIPEKADIVKEIKKLNISLVSEIEFASRYTSAKIIAITGSNGKTTTTLLTYHLLKEAGLKVGLAGNIGQSFAKQVLDNQMDYFVIEISSFQLDRCFKFKPDVSILLNITPDHLDRYEYKFENYIQSKLRIFQNASDESQNIIWEDDEVLISHKNQLPSKNLQTISFKNKNATAFIQDQQIEYSGNWSLNKKDSPIKGPHNAINLSAAILAAQAVGISREQILKALPTFINAEHRLEPCGIWNGVEFINDSKATNVDAVFYALNSFEKGIILIIGGVDKGNDYSVLDNLVKKRVKGIVCLGTDNEKLIAHFGPKISTIISTTSLKEAVETSAKWAIEGDTILLSPACASFDLFKNYEDRGKQFKETVKNFIHAQN
ncbi:UDP-N-acetylmuramoyl-L-alanine--D-glutamate ligase [Sandaracinomonas limnophila]|uniref:UDP-N-acetylmuramoylalanine--D-glutamate ligase n=1 Tax=Sandaracinomonas limnophila TaxID=1862386 RepID=A0A437PRN6_9BACT|nr:UDP-N-acetylmuramoyl-L-alanine--D-glutamate ligase [Sandaracinomonas limnophila]RVU24924.1 UDP-N-acetylmuramoyl-L-alanine--D-glutamate ligase [Sandaracinomonas limnophila]